MWARMESLEKVLLACRQALLSMQLPRFPPDREPSEPLARLPTRPIYFILYRVFRSCEH